jgi:collagen type III alpha
MGVPFELWGQRGWAGVDVVGESHYSDAIRDVFGDEFRDEGCELSTGAELVPEPWNRHDCNAVGVWIGGRQVGYLSRDDAARYAPTLSGLVDEGWAPQVRARVWAASGFRDRPGITGSVQIDLAEPHLIVPANRAPERAYHLLPFGNAIQVTGEEKHLGALLPWLRPEGECWVHVTLHEVHEQAARGTRELIEVLLDGAPVGRLSPRTSGELLPAVRHLDSHGRLTAARAMVRGNRIKVEVVVHAARAHELPESWLAAIAESQSPDITIVNAGAPPGGPTATASIGSAPAGGPGAVTAERSAGVARPVVVPGTAGSATTAAPAPAAAGGRGIATLPGADLAAREGRAGRQAAAEPAGRHGAIPPRPAGVRFVVPPGWPQPPAGWSPPAGWRPDPEWPPAPAGWQWWVPFWT